MIKNMFQGKKKSKILKQDINVPIINRNRLLGDWLRILIVFKNKKVTKKVDMINKSIYTIIQSSHYHFYYINHTIKRM